MDFLNKPIGILSAREVPFANLKQINKKKARVKFKYFFVCSFSYHVQFPFLLRFHHLSCCSRFQIYSYVQYYTANPKLYAPLRLL